MFFCITIRRGLYHRVDSVYNTLLYVYIMNFFGSYGVIGYGTLG